MPIGTLTTGQRVRDIVKSLCFPAAHGAYTQQWALTPLLLVAAAINLKGWCPCFGAGLNHSIGRLMAARCPVILDFEASGFDAHSYPIEVGVVTESGERYCSLIRPPADWQHWDMGAQKVHGITRKVLLEYGKSPAQVCAELNVLLEGRVAYSDAWVWDDRWLIALFYAGAQQPTFRLSPLEAIASEAQLMIWDQAKTATEKRLNQIRHRASADALLIQQTFIASRDRLRRSASVHL